MSDSILRKDICIITNKYPNKFEPNVLVFVQQLVWQFAKAGYNCTVICPMPININPKYGQLPYKTEEVIDTGESINVYRPKYFGLGQSNYGHFNPAKITTYFFTNCVYKTIKKNNLNPILLYAHFVTPAGIAAARISKKIGIPAFMAHGEATMMTIEHIGGPRVVKEELEPLVGIIAVASSTKQMLIDNDISVGNKIEVFPNAFNTLRFYKMDKSEARKKLNLPETDDFLVGLVGSFDERKGVLRLQAAVEELEGVKFACAGKGTLKPSGEKCVFAEPVNNEDLVYFYNACDAFVLPTLREGCCNAIVEAIACGLPIISSDLSFNDDILDETNSIRINPNSVEEIASAISKLRDDKGLRQQLSKGSLEKSKELTLEKRAENILRFMEAKI